MYLRTRTGVSSRRAVPAVTGAPRSRWGALVRVTLALALVAAAAPAPPAASQDVARTPAQLRLDLDRLRGQIGALEARLATIGEERETLVDEFETADVQLALSRRRLELIQLRLQVLFQQLRELEAEVERLGTELEGARAELADRVVALYRMGPLSYTRFLLAADDPEDVLANYQLIGRLAAQDRSLVAGIERRIDEHERAVQEMNQTARDWQATRRDETIAIRTLSEQQEHRRELIRKIDIETAAQRRALEQQQESAVELETMLDAVASTPVVVERGAERPAFASARGELPWPARGPITESFGRKVHPVYDTVTLVKGIEIDAGAGSPVQAVYRGRIAFADWFQNYGMVVIVNHGNDFFTIYGHLDTIAVRTGEWVDAGTQVGTVGETGSLIGPSLYFEIREGAEAVNPTLWLRPR